jgi:hypothetical protein
VVEEVAKVVGVAGHEVPHRPEVDFMNQFRPNLTVKTLKSGPTKIYKKFISVLWAGEKGQ